MNNKKQNNDLLIFKPYEDQDEDVVIRLWEAAFNKHMPGKVWRWKFHDNPYGRQMMVCWAEQDRPIALYAGISYSGNRRDQVITFTHLMDSMTHPQFRGKGIFAQTFKHFFALYGGALTRSFHYGLPGLYHFQLGRKYLNYKEFPGGQLYLKSDYPSLLRTGKTVCGNVQRLTKFEPVFDQLHNNISKYYPFAARRDNRFVKWRFFNHPEHTYFIYVHRNFFKKILGYAVILLREEKATLVDFFSLPDKKIIKKLLTGIENDLKDKAINFIQAWFPSRHIISETLMESGFRSEPEPLGFVPIWVKENHVPEYEEDVENIFFSMADGDLF